MWLVHSQVFLLTAHVYTKRIKFPHLPPGNTSVDDGFYLNRHVNSAKKNPVSFLWLAKYLQKCKYCLDVLRGKAQTKH